MSASKGLGQCSVVASRVRVRFHRVIHGRLLVGHNDRITHELLIDMTEHLLSAM
jgi:hypothetical protein